MTEILWLKTKQTLKALIPDHEYIVWIDPIEGKINDNILEIFCPNDTIRDHIKDKLYYHLLEAAKKTLNRLDITIKIKAKSGRKHISRYRNEIDYDSGLNKSLSFGNFVKGQSNEFAYACCQSMATGSSDSDTLFIFGESSIGKSHLLNAIGNRMLELDYTKKVLCVYTKDFIRDTIKAINDGTINKLVRSLSDLDCLLVDDIHLIAGKDRTQEEFFYVFENLLNQNKKVIFVSDVYPRDVDNFSPRIRNRVLQGPVVFIDLPEYETRVGILKEFAKREGIDHLIPEDAYQSIAERVKRHARALSSMIKTIKGGLEFRKINQKASAETILNIVKNNLEQEAVQSFSVDRIKKVTCAYYNINNQDLISQSRMRSILKPRQIAMYLARKYTDASLAAIGQQFNKKEHATVINACNQIEAKIKNGQQKDAALRKEIAQIELILRS